MYLDLMMNEIETEMETLVGTEDYSYFGYLTFDDILKLGDSSANAKFSDYARYHLLYLMYKDTMCTTLLEICLLTLVVDLL